jgi:hypothetical protein
MAFEVSIAERGRIGNLDCRIYWPKKLVNAAWNLWWRSLAPYRLCCWQITLATYYKPTLRQGRSVVTGVRGKRSIRRVSSFRYILYRRFFFAAI